MGCGSSKTIIQDAKKAKIRNSDSNDISKSKTENYEEETNLKIINLDGNNITRSNTGISDEDDASHPERIIRDGDYVFQSKTTTNAMNNVSNSEKSILDKDGLSQSKATTSDEDNVSQCRVKISGGENQSQLTNYDVIDNHARKAPYALRTSAEDLINYLVTPSKEPKVVVRAIFVWITDNISYDKDGLEGRAAKQTCDAESVMKNGSCVCAGYANVLELLCRTAKIPVQTISGYSKGASYSADKPITLKSKTNHAWNAVQLDGKWYLMDSTWGSGHTDGSNKSIKEFEDFWFMADPKQMISSHFPYMDNDLEASLKWQLLDKPVSFDKFSSNVRIFPYGLKLGLSPSRTESVIKMKNELELSFKTDVKNVVFSSKLSYKDGYSLRELPYSTFDQTENGIFKLKIHPNKKGKYRLHLFGKQTIDHNDMNASLICLLKYEIECNKTTDTKFECPKTYTQAQKDKCILLQPLRGNIPANKSTKFCVKAPGLLRVMVGKTFLEKKGTTFEGIVETGPVGTVVSVSGSKHTSGSLPVLYKFRII